MDKGPALKVSVILGVSCALYALETTLIYAALKHSLAQFLMCRWEIMARAIDDWFPYSARRNSFGGTSFWITGPEWLNAEHLATRAAREGILIEPGAVYFAGPHIPRNRFRLGFSAIANERIVPGIKRLAALIDELHTG